MYYLQTARPDRDARRVMWRLGWALAALVVMEVAAQMALLLLFRQLAPQMLEESWFLSLLGSAGVYGAALPTALLILRTLPPPAAPAVRPPAPGEMGRFTLACFSGMYLSNCVTLLVMALVSLLRGAAVNNPVDSLQDQPLWVNLITACILAPVMEELLFRGAILRRLRPYGERFAAVASALLFALIHANLYQMLYAFVLGFLFAVLVLRTGQLWRTMVLHAGINFISALLLPLLEPLGEEFVGLFGLAVLMVIVVGAVYLIQGLRQLDRLCPRGVLRMWKPFFLNPGMVLFLLGAAVLTVMNLTA